MKWTGLHWASKRGHAKIVRLIIDQGADVNAKDTVSVGKDHAQYTLLIQF